MPRLMAARAPGKKKQRLVHDARRTDQLPGRLVRSEGQAKVADNAVNEAYDGSGDTYDFYDRIFGRNSLDDNGMSLISSVHVAEVDESGQFVPMNIAFWNGEQMAYGDGDGRIFVRFTKALDVVGHDSTVVEDGVLLLGEVVADGPDDAGLGEKRGREREVHGGAAQKAVALARLGLDGVKGNGSDYGERHKAHEGSDGRSLALTARFAWVMAQGAIDPPNR